MVRDPETKIMSLDQASAWCEGLKRQGRTVVVTNGCFDLIRRGHAAYLREARLCGDALLVAINSDASVSSLKGPTRPLVALADRAYVLASLECVDAVVVFDSQRATAVFEKLHPTVYVKGGDYTEETLDREEYAALKAGGARFRFIPFVAGFSTTKIVEKMNR